jgi:hypothetical protein
MIDLNQRTVPYQLELPYGLRVTVQPLTTAGMAAVQAAARRTVEAIERQARDLTTRRIRQTPSEAVHTQRARCTVLQSCAAFDSVSSPARCPKKSTL